MTGASSGPTFGRRLVFFGAAEAVGEPTLLQLFSQYGDVTGLFLVRSALGLPSGCGYVTMANAEQAAAALAALQGSSECAEAGGKLGLLIVQGPHTEQQTEQSQSPQQKQKSAAQTDDNRAAFFTKVPPTVTAHQLIQLFTACGDVVHVELFTPWPGAKISKGCGLVEFAAPEAAAAAVASLHQAFTWPHSHSPLVVEWLDAKRQAANRASKLVKHGSGDSTTNMRRTAAAAAADQDPRMAAAVGYGSHSGHIAGVAGQVGMQQYQQQAAMARSCPLPRLQQQLLPGSMVQPGWAAAANAGAAAHAQAVLQQRTIMQQVEQVEQHMAAWLQQEAKQQQADAPGSVSYWWPLQAGGGAASCYDNSGSLVMTVGSSGSASNSMVMPEMIDLSTGNLSCVSAGSAAMGMSGTELLSQQQQVFGGSGCQSPITSGELTLAMPGAAAAVVGLGGVCSEPMWQQLEQSNLMMMQPMQPMQAAVREVPSQPMYVMDRNGALMQVGGAAAAAGGAAYASLPTAAPGLALHPQQHPQLSVNQTCSSLYAAAAGDAAGGLPKQQQQWWAAQQSCSQPLQQQQQAAGGRDDAMMVVALSPRQLSVMSAVLPELPRLTGVKAYLGAGQLGRGVRLILSGAAAQVSSAHCVAAMMLNNMGISDPLLPAGMQ